jgi:proline dehydrogenase
MIASLARSALRRARRAYVAGPAIEDALRMCERLAARNFGATIGYWNRVGEPPRAVADEYLRAVQRIAHAGLDCPLSIKASTFGCSRSLMDEILARALEAGLGLHFDAMRPESAESTFALVAVSSVRSARVGCTLPGRWRRSLLDAERAIMLGVEVRVVKGQWPDPVRDVVPHEGYLSVIDRLAGRARRVTVATHDTELAREALRRLCEAGTPCELELLFGLPLRPSLRVAAEAGVSASLHVPYGESWLPYWLSRLRDDPQLLVWLACNVLSTPITRPELRR